MLHQFLFSIILVSQSFACLGKKYLDDVVIVKKTAIQNAITLCKGGIKTLNAHRIEESFMSALERGKLIGIWEILPLEYCHAFLETIDYCRQRSLLQTDEGVKNAIQAVKTLEEIARTTKKEFFYRKFQERKIIILEKLEEIIENNFLLFLKTDESINLKTKSLSFSISRGIEESFILESIKFYE